jgi:F0F1-type ATP synthase epsilon subunit
MVDNRLSILTEEAVPGNEIDVAKAREELKQAEGQVAIGEEAVAERDRKAQRARAMISIAQSARG